MAGTMKNNGDFYGVGGARDLVIEHNKVITDLDALRAAFVALTAKLDLDAGVTDTTYASLTNPAAVSAAKIGVNGTAITV